MASRNNTGSGALAGLLVGALVLVMALMIYLVWTGGVSRRQRIAVNLPAPSQVFPSPERLPNPEPAPPPLPRPVG